MKFIINLQLIRGEKGNGLGDNRGNYSDYFEIILITTLCKGLQNLAMKICIDLRLTALWGYFHSITFLGKFCPFF